MVLKGITARASFALEGRAGQPEEILEGAMGLFNLVYDKIDESPVIDRGRSAFRCD